LSDIIFVITSALSNDPIRFPDYARQRIRSALGKSNLVDQVKTLWKLSTPGKLAGNNFRPAVRLQMDSFHQRRVREKNHEADQREIVNALLRLEKISTHPSEEDDGDLAQET
ncbi:Helicase c-terminal domain containing protein, partial [Daphnia magna]